MCERWRLRSPQVEMNAFYGPWCSNCQKKIDYLNDFNRFEYMVRPVQSR